MVRSVRHNSHASFNIVLLSPVAAYLTPEGWRVSYETNSFTLASCPTKTGTIRWMLNEAGDDWPSEAGQHFLPYLPTPPLLLCRQTLQCGSGAVHTLLQLWSKATMGDSSYPWMTASYSVVTFFPHVFRIQKQVHLPFGRGTSCTLIVEKVQTLMNTTSDYLRCESSLSIFYHRRES